MEYRKRKYKRTKKQFKGCRFCLLDIDDKIKYGEMFSLRDKDEEEYKAHHFCLLFSPALLQQGEDNEGMQGFLLNDIKKELKRGQKHTCKYCKKKGANIGCIVAECPMSYHYPCGLEAGHNYQFHNKFPSECPQHRLRQKCKNLKTLEEEDKICAMCCEELGDQALKLIMCPLCRKLTHKECVQKQAYQTGMFLSCCHCRNDVKFAEHCKRFGIYVPNNDYAWERDGTYEGQETVEHDCCADFCLCPEGKSYHKEGTEWEVVACESCAGDSVHVRCANIPLADVKNWYCSICAKVLKNDDQKTSASNNTVSCGEASQCNSLSADSENSQNEKNVRYNQDLLETRDPLSDEEASDSLSELMAIDNLPSDEENNNELNIEIIDITSDEEVQNTLSEVKVENDSQDSDIEVLENYKRLKTSS